MGVLHTKHLAMAMIEHRGDLAALNLTRLATPPWFVPDTTTLEEQLDAFRERRTHFALVVDEYGALQGLVTLEDILGEIFGELPDEHQPPSGRMCAGGPMAPIWWTAPCRCAISIASSNGTCPRKAPRPSRAWSSRNPSTIPEPGQRFAFFGYKFEVLRRQRNQITALQDIAAAQKREISSGLILFFRGFGGRKRGQRQGMDSARHFFRQNVIDQPLTRQPRQAGKFSRHDPHGEMRFAAASVRARGAGMAGMPGAVVGRRKVRWARMRPAICASWISAMLMAA